MFSPQFSQSEAVVAFFEPSPWDRTFRLLEGSSVRAKENQTITAKEEETIRPEKDRTFGPKEAQTIKVEEKEQTFGPEEAPTIRPKEDQTFGPVKEQTVRLQEDLNVGAQKNQTIRAEEEQSHRVGEGPRRGSVDQTIREEPLDVFQRSVVLSGRSFSAISRLELTVSNLDPSAPTRWISGFFLALLTCRGRA